MKLIDLSYFYYNMTSIEEIDVENYFHIKKFIDNFELNNSEINLDFLELPNLLLSNAEGIKVFSIGKSSGALIYTENDKKLFLEQENLRESKYKEEIIEFLFDVKLPYAITFSSLNPAEKEAVYHLFMLLK